MCEDEDHPEQLFRGTLIIMSHKIWQELINNDSRNSMQELIKHK